MILHLLKKNEVLVFLLNASINQLHIDTSPKDLQWWKVLTWVNCTIVFNTGYICMDWVNCFCNIVESLCTELCTMKLCVWRGYSCGNVDAILSNLKNNVSALWTVICPWVNRLQGLFVYLYVGVNVYIHVHVHYISFKWGGGGEREN